MRNLLRANLWYWTHSVPIWFAFGISAILGAVTGLTAIHRSDRLPDTMLFIPQYGFTVLALLLFLACLVLLAGKTHKMTDAHRKLLAGYSRTVLCISEMLTAAYLACIAALLNFSVMLVCGRDFWEYLHPNGVLIGAVCLITAYVTAAVCTELLIFATENPPLNMMILFVCIPLLVLGSDAAMNLNDSRNLFLRLLYFGNIISPIERSFSTVICNSINGLTGEFMGNIDTSYRLYTMLSYQLVLLAGCLLTAAVIYRKKQIK